jgi:transcription elongation factor Elf1
MSKASKEERTKFYKDHLVQVFLSKFLSGEIESLTPVFDPNHGYRYPVVETILGDSVKAENFLAQLSEMGILNRELYDKILFCPHCGSPKISIHYCCPNCKSFDVTKSALVEHLQCGYIDTEDRFAEEDKLICPRCGKELVKPDIDYRKAGIWCTCSECKKSFDIPVPSHFCRDCHKNFTFEDATYKNVYLYTLSEKAKEEASLGWILVAPVKEFLETRGFEVETPGFLKGKSGASHMFDITAYRKGVAKDVTVIDFATSGENVISEQPVIAMFAKIYDVAPDNACLIAIPRITDNGKKMAKLYNITLIEAKNPKEAVKALESKCTKQKNNS